MCIKEQGNEYLNRTEKTRQNKTYRDISAVTETETATANKQTKNVVNFCEQKKTKQKTK